MNNDMKCPFCQQELKELYVNGFSVGFRCKNKNCPETNIMCGTKALWQELIRTRKALGVAVDAFKSVHEYYQNCVIREWQPHEINWYYTAKNMHNDIFKALEQITALEQKDVK